MQVSLGVQGPEDDPTAVGRQIEDEPVPQFDRVEEEMLSLLPAGVIDQIWSQHPLPSVRG